MAHPDLLFHTADMVRDLIREDRAWPRYETFYGELVVTPAPRGRHQWLIMELASALHAYLQREPVGVVLTSPADISWGRKDVLVQPDVFVVPPETGRELIGGAPWTVVRHLLLAAEVVSPDSRTRDRFGKRALYQSQRVDRYWVLDAERRLAEVWTPEVVEPAVERERLVWHPAGAREAFVFDLAARFAVLDVR